MQYDDPQAVHNVSRTNTIVYIRVQSRVTVSRIPIVGRLKAKAWIFGVGHLSRNPGGWVGFGFTAVFGATCALFM